MVEVLEEGVKNDELAAVLAEYRKPVKITDAELGEFEFNKDWGVFVGRIDWLGESAGVHIDGDVDDEDTWAQGLQALRSLYDRRESNDRAWRAFAARELTALANDWREDSDDDDGVEIIPQTFADRVSLSELSVDYESGFIAYYDDDDMFWGHVITVCGSEEEGLKAANIEG